ncbi:retrovirus-related pol polyprotein from transposon 17.6 [Tanacetum coccineum]
MLAAKPLKVPLYVGKSNKPVKVVDGDDKNLSNISCYQKLIGKLIYLTITRPDIAYAVHKLSQVMHSPKQSDLRLAFKVLRYLKGSLGPRRIIDKVFHLTQYKESALTMRQHQLKAKLRYYRRFIKDCAVINYPLTKLLRKNAFVWNNEAGQAFEQLKQAMMAAPALKLPNFEEDFVVEIDASREGIGVVLQQRGHPVAYLSKALSPKHQLLSTYEKEFLAVLQALDK